jgi:hypothetical protein
VLPHLQEEDTGAEISVLLSTTLSKGTEAAQAVLARVSLSDFFNRASQVQRQQPTRRQRAVRPGPFVSVKARKCDRSLQTSPVWRGLNTADSADSYMTGYSPAAAALSSASSFSRSVSCEPHQLLLTFSWRNPICSDAFCQRPNFRLSQMRFVPHLNSEGPCHRTAGSVEEPPERNLVSTAG